MTLRSVIGNSLDNGVTYGPYGENFQKICGMEVVLADGDILRTGMGAIPDSKAWHVYPRGMGPVLDQLFMQSNYGVVTRAGIWLMPRPEAFAPLFLTIPRDSQLEQAMDIIRELRLEEIVRGVPNIQNTITLASKFPELLGKFRGADKPVPEEELDQAADESGVGRWGMRTALWGDTAVVDHQLQRIRDAWSKIEGGRIIHERTYHRDEWSEITEFMEKVQSGIPSMDLFERVPDNVGHVGFAPAVPLIGTEIRRVTDRIKELVIEKAGSNFVCAIFPINARSALVVSSISFDTRDKQQVDDAMNTAKMLIREIAEMGYGEYRAHVHLMDSVSDVLSFNDHAYNRFVSKIKDAVDPKGILSPGRHGVWPESYRQTSK